MKRFFAIVLIILTVLTFCGCDAWMNGSYYSVTPHQEQNFDQNLASVEVSDYAQLQNALEELISHGSESGVIYVVGLDSIRLDTYVDMAVKYVIGWDAIGAYAVEDITYEVGKNAGRTAVAVNITYNRNRSEILRIKYTETMDEAKQEIAKALENCEAGVALLVENYTKTDFVQMIQDYVELHPEVCMELPQVSAAVYPDSGTERVVEISFTYQTSRDSLRMMQKYVQPVFAAASLNVSGEEGESAKFSRMYAFLMERNEHRIETSITPPYSLLRHGVGDSKAFATVYSAMCREAGLNCQVVSGTRAGAPWFWNIICEDGVYYYVDLLMSETSGRMLRMTENIMGNYVWDYSAYPQTGTGSQPTQQSAEETQTEDEESVPEEQEPTQETVPETETQAPDEETIPETQAPAEEESSEAQEEDRALEMDEQEPVETIAQEEEPHEQSKESEYETQIQDEPESVESAEE